MHLRAGILAAAAFPCLVTFAFGESAYNQRMDKLARQPRLPGYTYLNCEGLEPECLISETPVSGVRIVRPKDYSKRPAHYLSSNLYTTLAGGRETGNRFVAFDFQVPVTGGPLPHTHRNEWESFFVSDGVVNFVEGVQATAPYNYNFTDVPASTVVYGPQGPVHGFQNKSVAMARIFSFAMPAGLDSFFHNAGSEVVDFNAPIPAIDQAEIIRTAFWAEQRGDALWQLGAPPPVVPPTTPDMLASSFQDSKRPTEPGPFGETRVVMLSPQEVGNITGATAFCGPGRPGRQGGTVKYAYFSMQNTRTDFPAPFTSQYTEVFYTLGGNVSFNFSGTVSQTVTVESGTYIQIEPGIPFSIANIAVSGAPAAPARSLAISVIPPAVCQ